MATKRIRLMVLSILTLFLLSSSGCVGIIVGAVIIKKKRDRARAAAEVVEEEKNPASVIPSIPEPKSEPDTLEIPAPAPLPPTDAGVEGNTVGAVEEVVKPAAEITPPADIVEKTWEDMFGPYVLAALVAFIAASLVKSIRRR
jgi:hypothetical protein